VAVPVGAPAAARVDPVAVVALAWDVAVPTSVDRVGAGGISRSSSRPR